MLNAIPKDNQRLLDLILNTLRSLNANVSNPIKFGIATNTIAISDIFQISGIGINALTKIIATTTAI